MRKILPALIAPLMGSLIVPILGEIVPLPITKHPYARDGFDPGIYPAPTSLPKTATLLPRLVPREAPASSSMSASGSTVGPIYGSYSVPSGSAPSGMPGVSVSSPANPYGSPSPYYSSTSPSPSPSGSTKTPLQLANHLLESSSTQCNVPGGGCAVFNLTLEPCTTDTDVCQNEVTLAAMVCAHCNANQDSFDQYNDYLRLCQSLGVANPSDTIRVPISDASGYGYAMPSLLPSPGSSGTSTSGAGMVYSSGPSMSGVVGLLTQMPSGSGSISAFSPTASPALSSSSSGASGSAQHSPTGESSPRFVAGFLNPSAEESDPIVNPSPASSTGSTIGIASPTSSPPSAADPSGLRHAALLATDMGGTKSVTSGAPSVINLPSVSTNVHRSSASSSNSAGDGADRSGVLGLQYESYTVTNTLSTTSKITLSPSPTMIGTMGGDAVPSGAAEQRLEQSKLALNAAIGYFSYQIDSKCDNDCSTWKSLSNTCTQDLCICTDPGVLSASACSSCLGTTTHGQQYQQQIGYYNYFTANCSMEVAGLSPSTSGESQVGYDIVAAATSRLSTSGASTTNIKTNGTAAGAAEAVVTVVKSSADLSISMLPRWVQMACAMGGTLSVAAVLI